VGGPVRLWAPGQLRDTRGRAARAGVE